MFLIKFNSFGKSHCLTASSPYHAGRLLNLWGTAVYWDKTGPVCRRDRDLAGRLQCRRNVLRLYHERPEK